MMTLVINPDDLILDGWNRSMAHVHSCVLLQPHQDHPCYPDLALCFLVIQT